MDVVLNEKKKENHVMIFVALKAVIGQKHDASLVYLTVNIFRNAPFLKKL